MENFWWYLEDRLADLRVGWENGWNGLIKWGIVWSPPEAYAMEWNACPMHQSLAVLWGWTGMSHSASVFSPGSWELPYFWYLWLLSFEPTAGKYLHDTWSLLAKPQYDFHACVPSWGSGRFWALGQWAQRTLSTPGVSRSKLHPVEGAEDSGRESCVSALIMNGAEMDLLCFRRIHLVCENGQLQNLQSFPQNEGREIVVT